MRHSTWTFDIANMILHLVDYVKVISVFETLCQGGGDFLFFLDVETINLVKNFR